MSLPINIKSNILSGNIIVVLIVLQVLQCCPEYRCCSAVQSTGVAVLSRVQVLQCCPEDRRCSAVLSTGVAALSRVQVLQ